MTTRSDHVPLAAHAHASTGSPVLVASDARLYGEGLRLLLAADGRLRVTAVVDAAAHVLDSVARGGVDAALVDATMPDASRALRELRDRAPHVPVVMFGMLGQDEYLLECIEAGAVAFVSREASSGVLIETVLAALRGEVTLSPRSVAQVLRRLASRARTAPAPGVVEPLTAREREVASLLDEGLSNKEIAQRLRIGVATVKNHVHRILEKLHVRRRGQAASRLRHLLNQRI